MKKERNNLLKNALILAAFTCIAQVVSAQATKNIGELVEPGEPIRIATGFSFTEGPVWHPDGFLLFTDIPGNSIYKWTPNGKVEKFRSPSGHSNGLTFDQQGRLIACEHSNRRIHEPKIMEI